MGLFVVIGFCMEVGSTLAYLLLESGTGGAFLFRVDSCFGSPNAVKQQLPELRPEFFYGQKSSAD